MNEFSGMIQVSNLKLIASCKSTIEAIKAEKETKRQVMIENKMNNMVWWWNNLYRFFFLPKPTLEKAERKAFECWRDQASIDLIGCMTIHKLSLIHI